QRLLRGLLRRAVAQELGVDVATFLNWETNKVEPLARLVPRIVRFLGYHPWRPPGSVADWLRTARRALGLTQRELGWLLRVDPATVPSWEAGRHRPTRKLMAGLRKALADAKVPTYQRAGPGAWSVSGRGSARKPPRCLASPWRP